MKVKKFINSTFNSNTYVLSEADRNFYWLIDVGDVKQIIEYLPIDAKVSGIFLTHTHFDHIYGLNRLIDIFPDCKVYTSDFGRMALYSDRLNFSKYHDTPFLFSGTNVEIVYESSLVEPFSDYCLNVLETPGHDPSCLTFKVCNYLFTGDSYIPGLKVITSFPRSDKKQADSSLKRILGMIDETTIVCPGHNSTYLNGFVVII